MTKTTRCSKLSMSRKLNLVALVTCYGYVTAIQELTLWDRALHLMSYFKSEVCGQCTDAVVESHKSITK